MKCPKCSYISFDYLDECKKCGRDFTEDKVRFGIRSIKKKVSRPVVETVSGVESSSGTGRDFIPPGQQEPLSLDTEKAFSLDDISFGDPGKGSDEEKEDDFSLDDATFENSVGEVSSSEITTLANDEERKDEEGLFPNENLDDISFDSKFEPTFDGHLDVTEEELQGPGIVKSQPLSDIAPGEEWSKGSTGEERSAPFGAETPEGLLVDEPAFEAVLEEEPAGAVKDWASEDQALQDKGLEGFTEEESPVKMESDDVSSLSVKETGAEELSFEFNATEEEKGGSLSKVAEAIPNIEAVKKGGFFRRALAYTVDNVVQMLIIYAFIIAGLYALKKGTAFTGAGLSVEHMLSLTGPIALLSLIVNAGYFTFFHWAAGQTPGKMILGLKVVMKDGTPVTLGRSFLRWFGYTVSALPLMLGYLMVLIDRQKQALHDKIAGTYVINSRTLAKEGEKEDFEEASTDAGVDEEVSLTVNN